MSHTEGGMSRCRTYDRVRRLLVGCRFVGKIDATCNVASACLRCSFVSFTCGVAALLKQLVCRSMTMLRRPFMGSHQRQLVAMFQGFLSKGVPLGWTLFF